MGIVFDFYVTQRSNPANNPGTLVGISSGCKTGKAEFLPISANDKSVMLTFLCQEPEIGVYFEVEMFIVTIKLSW